MKHRLEKRNLGIEIPGFTDAILARLSRPYDLIAEWGQYVPLNVLLEVNLGAMACFRDNDDGTVTLKWDRFSPAWARYDIPLDLFRRTADYLENLHRNGERHRRPGQGHAIFLDDGFDIRSDRWLRALERAF